jgi:hypothetical protein
MIELKADAPDGKTLDGSAPICEISELTASVFDGKMPVGSTETPDGSALICDTKELSAEAPDGIAPEGMPEASERSELNAGTPEATTPVGSAVTRPVGDDVIPALMPDSSELNAGTLEG